MEICEICGSKPCGQDFHDVLELHLEPLFLGNTSHVHQAGAVWSCHETGTRLHVPLYLVDAHLRTNGRLFHGEHTAKAATLVRALWLKHLDALHQVEQILDLVELRDVFFAGRTEP